MAEAKVLAEIRLATSALRLPWDPTRRVCFLYRQQAGLFKWFNGQGAVELGVDGIPDLGGIFFNGRALAIEVKSEVGQLRPAQRRFREIWIHEFNGLYLLARSPEFACEQLLQACESFRGGPGGG